MSADPSNDLLEAMSVLGELSKTLTPEAAADEIDPATLQSFWREWPHTSGWAGELWRRLNADLASPSTPQSDPELDEVGGSG